jgi:hypothetical protein
VPGLFFSTPELFAFRSTLAMPLQFIVQNASPPSDTSVAGGVIVG